MTQGDASAAAQERRIVAAMFLAGAGVYVQTYDAQALLPLLAADQGVSATASVLVLSATTVGMAVGVLPWAFLSDRLGRLRVIRMCLVAATLVSLVSPLLPGFDVLLALRLVKGLLLGGVTGLAVAFLFERVRLARAVIASGVYISGNTVGGVLTRVLSGIVADHWGWRVSLEVVAVLGVGFSAAFLLLTRRVPDAPVRRAPSDDGEGSLGLWQQIRANRVLLCFVQGFVALGVFNALFSLLPFRLAAAHPALGAVSTSAVLGLYAVAFASAQSGGRLAARFGVGLPLWTGHALALGGLGVLALGGLPALVVGVIAVVLGVFLVHPLNSAESGRRVTQHRAQSTALYQISWLGGATVVGPVVSAVYERLGWHASLAALVLVSLGGVAAAAADTAWRRSSLA